MDHTLRREHGLIALCLALATAAWVLLAGKDLSWDFLNHQLYLPFSLLSGRFDTDLLAAGPQSYQNPVGYVPMYLLVRSGLPAWAVSLTLALATTALQAWALLRIVHQVFGSTAADREWRWLAVALSFAAPVHLLLVGGTSNDPLCAALTLVALAIVLDPAASGRAVALAGLATGLAIAIKPTSLAFGLPTVVLAGLHVSSGQWPLRRVLQGVAWAVLAFALAGGLWAAWLWQHFGNPTYPLLNQVFQSPLAPAGATVGMRFLPQSAWDWVLRPFQMVQFKAFVSLEAFAPDVRPAAALLATLAAAAVALRRHGAGRCLQAWRRPDVQLVLFLALAYVLWLPSSGNARYAIPWFMLAGLVLVRAVQQLAPGRQAMLALLVLLGLQLAGYGVEGDRRLSAQAWGRGTYLPVDMPARLKAEPVLHLSMGVQSYSALVTELHPEGAFVNLRGQMSLPNQGPLADRLQQQLDRWKGRTRILFAPRFPPGSEAFATAIDGENFVLQRRFGLRIDRGDCLLVRILGAGDEDSVGQPLPPDARTDPYTRRLVSCAATLGDRLADPQFERELREADQVFDLLQANCPQPFGPHPMITDANPGAFWRLYMNSGAVIEISRSQGVVASYHRASEPIYLGTPEQVVQNRGKDACTAWKKLLAQ